MFEGTYRKADYLMEGAFCRFCEARHPVEAMASAGQCLSCRKARQAAWHRENREACNARDRAWRRKNRAVVTARERVRRAKRREELATRRPCEG